MAQVTEGIDTIDPPSYALRMAMGKRDRARLACPS